MIFICKICTPHFADVPPQSKPASGSFALPRLGFARLGASLDLPSVTGRLHLIDFISPSCDGFPDLPVPCWGTSHQLEETPTSRSGQLY